MGWQGMPRRYHVYPDVFQVYHVISTGGAAILAVAYVMPLIYLGWSILWGERAGDNPWNATGLEWQTTSPPPQGELPPDPPRHLRALHVSRARRTAAAGATYTGSHPSR